MKGTLAGAVDVLGVPDIIPATVLGAGGATPPSDRITLGSIGVGVMGGSHVRGFLQHEDVRLVAVCDVRESARQRAQGMVNARYGDKACAAYNDFRELLARPDIDAVVIATPEFWHPFIGIEAARQGKHMYYEKPMSRTVEEAQALREAVRRSGVVFQFGTQQRSSFYFRHACELVRNGKIGQLKSIAVGSAGGYLHRELQLASPQPVPAGLDWEMWLGPAPWAPYSDLRVAEFTWMNIYDYGLGGMGGEYGIHDLDIAQWVNDADHTGPITVEGNGECYRDIRDTISDYEVEYIYANGVRLHFMDLVTARKRVRQFELGRSVGVVIFGTEGWIWVSREGIRTQPESLVAAVIGPNEIRVMRSKDHKRNFLDAIRTGRQTISPVEVGARDEMVCQMADIAIRMKRKLRWDPVKEVFDDEAANRRLSRPKRGPWRL
jgi:predicted dehydrogenase